MMIDNDKLAIIKIFFSILSKLRDTMISCKVCKNKQIVFGIIKFGFDF